MYRPSNVDVSYRSLSYRFVPNIKQKNERTSRPCPVLYGFTWASRSRARRRWRPITCSTPACMKTSFITCVRGQVGRSSCLSPKGSVKHRLLTALSFVAMVSVIMLVRTVLLSASLYFSKRGAYWDRLCRDVVGRWLVVTCVHCGQTMHPRPIVTMEH